MRVTRSVRAALRRRPDDGSTMVAVIGVSAVVAVLMLALVGTVVFAIGQTTAARASVNAKSVAESAMETVAAQVAGGVCPVGGSASGTGPAWRAQVQRLVAPGADVAVESSWTNGCPTAAPADAAAGTPFRIIATGTTAAKGTGNATGDVRTMVGQFAVKQRPMSPEFNSAIFGKLNTTANTNLVVNGTGADVLSDKVVCSTNGDIAGNLLINAPSTSKSDMSDINTACKVRGDLITKGSLSCPAVGSVGGDVIVAGDLEWNTECHAGGDVWVGGSMNCPALATIGGDVTVVGDLEIKTECSVGGDLYVGGDLKTSTILTFPGNVWVKGRLTGNGGSQIRSTGGTIRVGIANGSISTSQMQPAPAVFPDPSLPAPPAPDMATYFPPSAPSLNFPKVSMSDARWAGWTMRRWVDDLNPLRFNTNSWGPDVCNSNSDGVFRDALTVTTPSIYDLTAARSSGGCGPGAIVGLGGELTIKLGADMVMFVPGAQLQTRFRIESLDGQKHTLYLIESWPTGMAQCGSAPSSIRGINLGAWGHNLLSQGPNTSLMVYTPGDISATGKVSLTGQLYGCNVQLSTPVTLNFQAANAGSGSSGRMFAVTESFRLDKQSAALY